MVGSKREKIPRRTAPPMEAGWKWLYTRGYDVAASAEYAFRWLVGQAPPPGNEQEGARPRSVGRGPPRARPTERREYRHAVERVTEWEIIPPDLVIFHDTVSRRGRVEVLGQERYLFMGNDHPGCMVEVTVLRKPVSWVSRLGFALAPTSSGRTPRREAELFHEIDRDYKRHG